MSRREWLRASSAVRELLRDEEGALEEAQAAAPPGAGARQSRGVLDLLVGLPGTDGGVADAKGEV